MYSGCYGPDRASLVLYYSSYTVQLSHTVFKRIHFQILRFRGGKFGRAPPLLYPRSSFKTRIRAYQSRNASACQAPSSAYKRGRARPEMVKHALTNGGYFQTLSFVCITYYYTHTQINDFMSMRRNRLDQVAGGIFGG